MKKLNKIFTALTALIILINFSLAFAGGDGSSSNPYQIETWEHLDSMRNNLDSSFVLNNNLDSSTAGYDTYASSNVNGGSGWNPVGDNSNKFTGALDGKGHTVDGLYIDRGSEGLGLIGEVGNGGTVQNIGIMNVNITGGDDVGGLIGKVGDEVDASVSNSFSTGSVSGGTFVGGLIGYMAYNGGTSVSNTYSTVNVSGSNDITGGLVGYNAHVVSNSFSTGSVSGGGDVGGLVANNDYGSVSSSYWDTESSGQSTGIDQGLGDVTGLDTSQMTGSSAESNMPDLDFSDTWSAVNESDSDASSDGYPILKALDRERQLRAQGIYDETFAVDVDWSSYSSSTNVNGFKVYYGIGSVNESNSVEVEDSVDTKQISSDSWSSGDNICVEVRPFNSNGEASSQEQCVELN